MKRRMSTPMNPADNRRRRLRLWIDTHFGGSQAAFIGSTFDGNKQINQGELSALLGTKSFGERRARSLELQSHMPAGYLDSAPESVNQFRANEATPLSKVATPPTGWPFSRVTLRRIMDLKKTLGALKGVEAINDLDETLEIAVQKWEQRASRKKSSNG